MGMTKGADIGIGDINNLCPQCREELGVMDFAKGLGYIKYRIRLPKLELWVIIIVYFADTMGGKHVETI